MVESTREARGVPDGFAGRGPRVLGCALLALQLCGCFTGLGLGIGSLATRSETSYEFAAGAPEPAALASRLGLSTGDGVSIVLRSGEMRRGSFRGLVAPTKTDPELYLLIDLGGSDRLSGEPDSADWLRIASSRIEVLRVRRQGHGKTVGILVGAGLDVAAFAILSSLALDVR